MEFVIGLILGAIAGICGTALCVSGKSKNVFTNADRIALNTDQLAEMIYRADDVSPDICQAEYEGNDLVGCRYPDAGKGCIKCIKEWLNKEVDTE